MATIHWSVGDLFMSGNPENSKRFNYGVVTSHEEECILVVDTGLRGAGKYRISSDFIPDSAVPLPPIERKNVPFGVKMALEAAGVVIGVPNFCTRC